MTDNRGVLVVSEESVVKGNIRNGRHVEIYGYVEGEISSDALTVHRGGRLFGNIRVGTAEIHGEMQGDILVKNLIHIGSSGSVVGKVHYGQLAIEHGGNLSAEVKNVPPSLTGDFTLEAARGQSVPVSLKDVNALDPDDEAKDLIFVVSHATRGFVSLSDDPERPVSRFTQADLQSGRILFTHDGSSGSLASFDVTVTDHAGATSGRPQLVRVEIRD